MNAFIITLASYIWVRGLVVAVSGGRSAQDLAPAIRWFGIQRFLGLPLTAWIAILCFVGFSLVMAKTPFGRHLIMIGGNETATFRAGIRVKRNLIIAFVLAGAIAGLAGWLLAIRTSGATANLGVGLLFNAFAAVVIGGVSLKGGVGSLPGVYAGVLLLSSINTAINLMGLPANFTQVIHGLPGACGSASRHVQADIAPEARMTGRLEGKVALIVGAARGIGKGIALRFKEEGARLVLADIESAAGQATADELGVPFIRTDISKMGDAEAAVALALATFGRLDIVVQNAGIYPWQLIENTSSEDWDRVMAVNLRGSFNAARAALVPMKAQGSGRMLFTSSITGPHVTSPGHGHYSATKAGINGFIRSAALEFSGYGITVNGVEPGNILTEAIQEQRGAAFIKNMENAIPLGRLGSPRDVANAFLFLASDDASYITGTTIVVDGGQLLPEGADFRILPP